MAGPLGAFHRLVAGLDYPMFVVTAAAGGERSGCLVGFVTQASISPARMLVLVSKANHTLAVSERADGLVVHVLDDRDGALASLFGEETGDQLDKFARCAWRDSVYGPVLAGTAGWFGGPIRARYDLGDHVAHLLDIAEAEAERDGRQLGYQALKHLSPGHPA